MELFLLASLVCFTYCNSELFGSAFLNANLNPIAFFIWGNFLNPVPLWIFKFGKRVRHEQGTDAPGCLQLPWLCECETGETALQWNTADLALCLFWAQLALIYWWRIIQGVKSKGWMKPLTRVSTALEFTANQKLQVGEIFPCVCGHSQHLRAAVCPGFSCTPAGCIKIKTLA